MNLCPSDALRVLRLEFFGDAQQGRHQAKLPALLAIERSVRRVRQLWLGLAVMIAHEGPDHGPPPPPQSGDLAVANQVLSVALVRFAIDEMTDIVQQRARFQAEPQVRSHLMDGS